MSCVRFAFALFLVAALLQAGGALGQPQQPEHYLTLSGNLHIPHGTPEKGVFPILWYDKEVEPSILIGGLGVGYAFLRPTASGLIFKGQANLFRHIYWDEQAPLLDENGNRVQDFYASSADYSIGFAATGHHYFSDVFSAGTGIGAHVLLLSLTRAPEPGFYVSPDDDKRIVRNRYYRTVMPTIPVEASFRSRSKLYCIRYEVALLNRYKNDLRNVKKDHYGLLTFELGFRLGAKEKNQPE